MHESILEYLHASTNNLFLTYTIAIRFYKILSAMVIKGILSEKKTLHKIIMNKEKLGKCASHSGQHCAYWLLTLNSGARPSAGTAIGPCSKIFTALAMEKHRYSAYNTILWSHIPCGHLYWQQLPKPALDKGYGKVIPLQGYLSLCEQLDTTST